MLRKYRSIVDWDSMKIVRYSTQRLIQRAKKNIEDLFACKHAVTARNSKIKSLFDPVGGTTIARQKKTRQPSFFSPKKPRTFQRKNTQNSQDLD
jgi:hypothetical protein